MNIQNNSQTYAGAVTAFAVAAIPFCRAFHIYDFSEEQANAILTLLTALIIVATVVVHGMTTSKAAAQDKIDTAWSTPNTAPPAEKPIA